MRNTIIEKSRRRLLVLTMGTLFVSLFGGGLFALNQWQVDKQYKHTRHEVRLAMQQGRYEDAIKQLTHALAFWPDDQQLLRDYLKAQQVVEHVSEQNLALTIEVLNRSLQSNPQLLDVAGQLTDVHMISGDAIQALKVTNLALDYQPNNGKMLKRRAMASFYLGDLQQAIADVDRCVTLSPTDYDLYLLRLYMAKRQGKSASQMTVLVESWREQLQYEAWYQALMGVSCHMNQLDQAAIDWLTQAAESKQNDPRLSALLIRQFDSLGQYNQAEQLLADVDVNQLPSLLYEKAWRLWQKQAVEKLLALQHQNQPAVIALQILACKRTNQKQRIDDLLTQFTEMPPTRGRHQWLKLVHLLVKDTGAEPQQWIEAARQVRMTCTNHELAEMILAQQYDRIGEKQAARDIWRALCSTSGQWVLPHLQQARLLMETGHYLAAAAAARKALECDRQSLEAGVLLVEALALSEGNPARKIAMTLLEQLSDRLSAEMRLLLEARLFDIDKVSSSVAQVLIDDQINEPYTWLELAQISLSRHGDWHNACLKRYQHQVGETADWMLLKAQSMLQDNNSAAARELIHQKVEQTTRQRPHRVLPWQLAQAKFLMDTDDQLSAHVAWKFLLDKYPTELSVCQGALDQPRDRMQPQLREQAITQLKQLTGSSAIRWRYEQALLILDQSRDNVSLSRAAVLLHDALRHAPSAINCRVLLMQCLQAIGSEQGVWEQAQAILKVDPYHSQSLEVVKQAKR